MSTVRDLPPIAGSIIWAKQIDRQLQVGGRGKHALVDIVIKT